MPEIATVDDTERIRATRIEVARLLALPYRQKLSVDEYSTRNHLLFEHVKTLPVADREAFEEYFLASHAEPDWSVLDEPWAAGAIELAVARVLRDWGAEKLSATKDDLTQSARIILAERIDKFRKARKPWIFLHQELVKLVRDEPRDTSLEALEAARDRVDAIEDMDDKGDVIWKGEPYRKGKWR